MTTDNRTNELTLEQVEAAAKAIADCHNPGMFEKYPENWRIEARAALEAASRAAQGAAPQASKKSCGPCRRGQHGCCDGNEYLRCECSHDAAPELQSSTAPQAEAYDHCCQHPKCPGGSLCCCASEQRLRDCWNQWREEVAGDSKQAFRDGYQAGQNDPAPWLTAPVLPSSGVDEEKLAEAIEDALCEFRDKTETPRLSDHLSRAVADWLKGQGR